MIIHNFEQGTPEWFAIRKNKMTASNAQAIGANGKWLDTYIKTLLSESYSSGEKEHFSSKDTDRGNELEPLAREIYELTTGNKVEQVWFIEYDEYVWCSPDGLVNIDGGIEIKSLNDYNHFLLLLEGISGIDTKYIWQIQMSLLITGRAWWDYVSYNPNFEKSLIVHRIYPDPKAFEALSRGIVSGKNQIKEIQKQLTSLT